MIKHKNYKSDQTQNVTKHRTPNLTKLKKILKCDKTQKLKMLQNSKTQNVRITQKLKM